MPLQFAAPPARKSPLGSRGPYQKLKPIGKGAFGTVFLVSKPDAPDNLVLKEVGLKGLNVAERKQTMNEVAILKKLTHPNIIAFHEAITVDQTLCVIMEYAEGGDLAGLIATQKKTGKRFPEAMVLRMSAEIMSAMSYCHHDLHLLHRDLKPQNIFLGKGGEVKLGDFGISKVLGASKAMAQTQCGTPLYMAPEICRGARYDRGADVWAIGCVLYEMMGLTPPWADKVPQGAAGGIRALMRLITTSQLNLPPLRAHYSPELCAILASLLAKSASARPALLDLLAKPLLRSALPKPPTPPYPDAPSPIEGSSPPASATRYRTGSIVLVRRTSGMETMAVVEKIEATSGLYSLSLVSKDGKLEGTKLAPEPDLREPSSPHERQMELLQKRRLAQQRARTPMAPIEEHAAAELLQRSFQKRRAGRKPMTPVAEKAPPNVLLQRPPVVVKHNPMARHGVGQQQLGGGQAVRPETLEQQQRRLAANAAKGRARGHLGAEGACAPFRPLL